MARGVKAPDHVVLFARIPSALSDALRLFAFVDRCAVADLVREALEGYVKSRGGPPDFPAFKRKPEAAATPARRASKPGKGERA